MSISLRKAINDKCRDCVYDKAADAFFILARKLQVELATAQAREERLRAALRAGLELTHAMSVDEDCFTHEVALWQSLAQALLAEAKP